MTSTLRSRLQLRLFGAASFVGTLALASAAHLFAELPQSRTLSLHNIHTDETVTVEFKKNGKFIPEAMQRINWVLRDWRRNEQITMDPGLIDLLWEVHTELGSKVPIDVICGYRSRSTNEMLRRTVGGQASESRHILGKAADVTFPDIPLKQLRYAAMVRERGGVGYYPTSGTPFVHIDTDRVRAWPRMPRFELALLFPTGHTQHKPAEGGDISPDDVRTARSRYHDLAVQVAAFHEMRRSVDWSTTMVADASAPARQPAATRPEPAPTQTHAKVASLASPQPSLATGFVSAPAATERPRQPERPVVIQASLPPPRLLAEPRVADRPTHLMPRPSEADRGRLAELVALAAEPALLVPPRPAQRPNPSTDTVLHSLTGADASHAIDAKPAKTNEANPRLAFASASATDALLGWSTGFVPAPEFDDDHPEDVAYRPFPIAPFLTATASADDTALVGFVHPDIARAVDALDQAGTIPPMRLRPAAKMAQLMWAQRFDGDAAHETPAADEALGVTGRIAPHKVKTEAER